ncbi:MAG: hypothetical protein ABL907_15550, partial [Hyphomicrobium sp.]
MPSPKLRSAIALLQRLKATVGHDLHEYPYPIAGCDEVFKTLVLQKECCRIALAGLNREDGLDARDAASALHDLMATPIALSQEERATLTELAQSLL